MKENLINSYLIQPLFFGFGLITIFLISLEFLFNKKINRLINSSILIIRYSGLLFLCLWFYYLLIDRNLFNRFIGVYWFSGWLLMFTYPILSQLFWIRKIINSRILIYIISCLILIANIIFSGKIICFDGDCDMILYFLILLKEISIYVFVLMIITFLTRNKN